MVSRREISSILFAVATFPVDYLVYALLPSISTIIIAIVTSGLLAVATALYLTGKRKPSIEEALLHSNQQRNVARKLDIHYHRIINRIDQTWDYRPSDGEQIFAKDNPTQRPKGLDQDKKHLRSFESAWNLYSDGPILYKGYKQAEGQAREKILDELISTEPALSRRLQESLTAMVMEKTQYAMSLPEEPLPFEAKVGKVGGRPMTFIDRLMLDVIDEPDPWTIEKAQHLASVMSRMAWRPDILYVVGERRDALGKLTKNQTDFLSAKDELVRRAKSVDCHLSELTDQGECDDCKPLKELLRSR